MNNSSDCISRQAVIDLMMQKWGENFSGDDAMQESIDAIRVMPSVTPQLSSELEKNSKKLDCISRADAIRVASGYCHPSNVAKELAKLPSVTPQELQSFEWCDTCKEYDQEKHCCHRWSKAIRDTIEEMKQEYIEREVLDKIRAEIVELTKCPYGTECLGANCPSNTDCMICGDHVLEIIDKYKEESGE